MRPPGSPPAIALIWTVAALGCGGDGAPAFGESESEAESEAEAEAEGDCPEVGAPFVESFDGGALDETFWNASEYVYWSSYRTGEQVEVGGGSLFLYSDADSESKGLPQVGGVDTIAFYGHGFFEATCAANPAPGTVSSFYTYYETDAGENDEIDVVELACDSSPAFVATGIYDNGIAGEKGSFFEAGVYDVSDPSQVIEAIPGFSSCDTHTYRMEWDAAEVRWYIDGVLVLILDGPLPDTPGQIFLDTYYNEDWSDFAGPELVGRDAMVVEEVSYGCL